MPLSITADEAESLADAKITTVSDRIEIILQDISNIIDERAKLGFKLIIYDKRLIQDLNTKSLQLLMSEITKSKFQVKLYTSGICVSWNKKETL